ncbi:unnamed protein product [Schistosoma margrebowiei]|uniref:TIR domain-containing protein n=2 Tax=Schistosoma margrebowiei TaxID=48269 RepID=A0AA84ZX75_9TREM|nr:unnamed protein product [Schistosoma margrebowiei]
MSKNDFGELYEATSKHIKQLIILANSKKYATAEFDESLKSFVNSFSPEDAPANITEYRTKVAVDILSRLSVFDNLISIYRELGRMAIPLSYSTFNPLPCEKWVLKLMDFQQSLTNYMVVSISFTQKLIKSDIYLTEVRRILHIMSTMKMSEAVLSLTTLIICSLNTSLAYEYSCLTKVLRDYGLRNILTCYTCPDPTIKLAINIFLTFTYTDISQLHLKVEYIELFMQQFHYTVIGGRKSHFFDASILNKVLRLLALNAENRIEFGNRDIVRHLTSLSDSQSYGTNEISTTTHILSSKVPVIDATQEILSLAEAYRSNITELEEKVRTYFEGASIDEFLLQYPTEPDIGDDQSEDKPSIVVEEGNPYHLDGHIMISYSHNDDKIALKIKESLENEEIKIWIDKDHMVQDVKILDAMANAVQNAAIVLILFSKSYQQSANTRAEAEYTRKLTKPTIFLRVESKFVPSGWLGFMIGESRYIDFSGKYPYEEKFEELCTTIKNGRIFMRFNVKE